MQSKLNFEQPQVQPLMDMDDDSVVSSELDAPLIPEHKAELNLVTNEFLMPV